ncbi:MAG: hypothetical protein SFY67_10510 [Candidatus Melainabacteria bacterium]|nr:hypothetical protein [Candidatus Melainabacteria bacterium]
MNMEARVLICHKLLHKRGAVSFQIKIDGQRVGEVTGFEREYLVKPGSHFAEVTFSFVKSNQVNFAIDEGGEVRLICTPNFWVVLLPLSIIIAFALLSSIPYSPSTMLYAGGALMVLAPILVIVIVLKPGMLVKLRIEK